MVAAGRAGFLYLNRWVCLDVFTVAFIQILRVEELPVRGGELICYEFWAIVLAPLMAAVSLAGALVVGCISLDPDNGIRIWVQLERGNREVWVSDVHQREIIWRDDHGGSGWGNHWHVFRGSAVFMQIFCDFALF